ncbi:MAG: ribosomal RNA small subunit methyltransferase A [Spirochaetes bacterium]|nr:ribosomal RNA small subunit methyltransferase A [Spirochaetota bacterium]
MTDKSYERRILTPSGIIGILKEQNLTLKKRYGQNFLLNRDIAALVIDAAGLRSSDTVLEIGPGLGALTFLAARRAGRVVACEIDAGLARLLERQAVLLGYSNIRVVTANFLKIDLVGLTGASGSLKVISNFPYNIGIRAVIRIIEELPSVEIVAGTVQEEMAERLMARPGSKNYAAVSIYVRYMANITTLRTSVSPTNFFPAPDVSSAVIEVRPSSSPRPVPPGIFRKVVKAAFSSRRKSLVNNLSALSGEKVRPALAAEVAARFGDERVRAEELSVEDFVALCETLSAAGVL